MSKKESEDQRKSNDKFREVFGRRPRGTSLSEEESLEVRLFRLIRNELQLTRGESELNSLENRIIRILRNEFVNDIMREVSAAEDEISAWFRRFLRSVPELSEAYRRVTAEAAHSAPHDAQKQERNKEQRTSKDGKEKQDGALCIDERIMDHIMEMFRVPIQITCRAGDDMRRVIRAGRRMIREMELLTRMRSDASSMRRVEMKCFDELDQMGVSRVGRSAFGGWRHILRRRCRSINPGQVRERSWYYVVFDRLSKSKYVPKLTDAKDMIMKLKKIRPWKILPGKGRRKRCKTWSEVVAKSEVVSVMNLLRRLRWIAIPNPRTSDSNDNESTAAESLVTSNAKVLVSTEAFETNVNNVTYRTCVDSVSTPHYEVQNVNSSLIPSHTPRVADVQLPVIPMLDHSLPRTDTPPFVATIDADSAKPEDINVALYTDRILEVTVFSNLPDMRRRRWMLPESVQIDNLQCFLEGGVLVITERPLLLHSISPNRRATILGPPTRESLPCPRPP